VNKRSHKQIGANLMTAGENPASRRIDTEITRTFLGMPGQPHYHVIFIVAPHA